MHLDLCLTNEADQENKGFSTTLSPLFSVIFNAFSVLSGNINRQDGTVREIRLGSNFFALRRLFYLQKECYENA